ncbi:hypothetical protein ACFY4C_41545 [Actinomadura viridis]|uniref:hypothetical protein n=1 Tax=Actinomadura viridis TaxID=58110 RepID=UPI0036807515
MPAPAPPPSSSARPDSSSVARPTARQIADRLADLYPIPNPRDNTHSCAPACRGLITTDAVSIYDWSDEASAKRSTSSKDRTRVGPYLLSFTGTEQAMTSQEARAKMAAELKRMTP